MTLMTVRAAISCGCTTYRDFKKFLQAGVKGVSNDTCNNSTKLKENKYV